MKMRTQFFLTMIIFGCLLAAAAASTIIIDYLASGLWTILVLVALMLAYFILIYLMFQRRALKSLATLNAGTAIIGAGNLDYVFPIHSKDEIGQLSDSINRMTANLKQVTSSKSELEIEIAERKKTEDELRRVARELRAISDCNQIMVRAADEQTLLNEVCRIMCEAAGYHMAWVGIVEHNDEKSITPAAWSGMEEGYLKNAAITWADTPRGRGPSGLAVRTGKTHFFQDFLTEPTAAPWREAALIRGYRSSIALPLTDANGETFAVLTLYAAQPNWFIPTEVNLLEKLARDMAFGVGVIRTRAERARAEVNLLESEEKFHGLYSTMNDGLALHEIIYDKSGNAIDYKITDVNPMYEEITGLSKEQAVVKNASELYGTNEPPYIDIYAGVASSGAPVSFETYFPPMDKYFQISVFSPKTGSFATVFSNITEHKKTEQKLREQSIILAQVSDAIIGYDANYRVTYWNHAAEKTYGYSAAEATGKVSSVLLKLTYTGDTREQMVKRLAAEGHFEAESERQTKDGLLIQVETHVISLSGEEGKITGYVAVDHDISERKKVEAEMAHLATFPELNPNPIVEIDRRGKIIYANYAITKNISDFLLKGREHPFLEEWDSIIKAFNGENISPISRELKVGDLWYDQTITFVPNTGTFRIYAKDITERKLAEEQLLQRAEELKTVMDLVPVAIWLAHDPECRNITGNRTANEFYEAEEGENVSAGPTAGETIPSRRFFRNGKELTAEELPMQVAAARNMDIQGSDFNVILPSGKSLTLWGSARPLRDEDGQVRGVVAAFLDITERKLAENALRETRDYLDNLFNYANAPIIVWDPQFRITRFNQAFERLTGRTAEKVIGEKLEIIFPENTRSNSMEHIREATAGKRMETEEIPIQQKDGLVLTVLWNSATLFEDDGKTPVATIAQGQDITMRKQAEENLERRTRELEDANKELESFSYSVSHDLREPLRAIDGFTRILDEDYRDKLDEEGQRILNTILKGTDKMGRLISDLLSFSRVSRQYMSESTVEMRKLAETVCDELKATSGNEREIECRVAKLPDAVGDTAMMRQVFTNLVSNAFKFTRPREKAIIEIGASISGKENTYYVKDNGVGFNDQYAHKLFNMFQRLHTQEQFEGTGVGLAIVQRIIQRQGGRVWAESKLGEGATFYFALPGK